jgi:hypothetical protein
VDGNLNNLIFLSKSQIKFSVAKYSPITLKARMEHNMRDALNTGGISAHLVLAEIVNIDLDPIRIIAVTLKYTKNWPFFFQPIKNALVKLILYLMRESIYI